MRISIPGSMRAGLCLAIWLCAAAGTKIDGCHFAGRKLVCAYDQSTYHIRTPTVADPEIRIPVVVILHDAGGSGRAVVNDGRLVAAFNDRGYAVLAPNALPRRNRRITYRGERPGMVEARTEVQPFRFSKRKLLMTGVDGDVRYLKFRKDTGWYFYNVDQAIYTSGDNITEYIGRDEIRALRDMLAHAAEEFGIDPQPVLVIGLGHGGSLVWQIACHAPRLAGILAPVGGAFWREIPESCQPGARLIHTHHRASAFWPLEGANGNRRRYARTSVYGALELLLRANRCGADAVTGRNDNLGVNYTGWSGCRDGGPVEFLTLDDAFAFQGWWLGEVLDRIEPLAAARASKAPEAPPQAGPAFRKPGSGPSPQSRGSTFRRPGSEAEPFLGGAAFKKPGDQREPRFKRAK
ncbi:MAG: alpha/beta hydrolase family esterase [Paracoccaceae bacterium]